MHTFFTNMANLHLQCNPMTVYSHQYWSMYSLCQPKGFWRIEKKVASNALSRFASIVIDGNEQDRKRLLNIHVLTSLHLSWLAEVLPLGLVLNHPGEFSKFVYKQERSSTKFTVEHTLLEWCDHCLVTKNRLNVIIYTKIIDINIIWEIKNNIFKHNFYYKPTFPDQQASTTLHDRKFRVWKIFLGGRSQCVMLNHDDGGDLKQQ